MARSRKLVDASKTILSQWRKMPGLDLGRELRRGLPALRTAKPKTLKDQPELPTFRRVTFSFKGALWSKVTRVLV